MMMFLSLVLLFLAAKVDNFFETTKGIWEKVKEDVIYILLCAQLLRASIVSEF
jgi:hypothetical protein